MYGSANVCKKNYNQRVAHINFPTVLPIAFDPNASTDYWSIYLFIYFLYFLFLFKMFFHSIWYIWPKNLSLPYCSMFKFYPFITTSTRQKSHTNNNTKEKKNQETFTKFVGPYKISFIGFFHSLNYTVMADHINWTNSTFQICFVSKIIFSFSR